MYIVYVMYIAKILKKICDVLPSGGLFLRTELIPLFTYFRAGL